MPALPDDSLKAMQGRIVELEIGLTHQQHLAAQLDEVVVEQTRQLMRLERSMLQLQRQLKELRGDQKERQIDPLEERPPHY
ncbi:SlyX family protein [Aureliella helgolandensis]|uniref:Protein SlyX n=1 Tax=Aureliella helgolandensis TaxID=2527968 RepID=A0A518G5D3_9BACT|nr:SlyX family protein [Aureliella helgolandensis]QDV23791.1 hypothetical protein Q31a_20960 [Aureliella helgolandensis]|tara:strand:+ start:429 stop:671 length:243 start_codon:yes stop_codon:yes gene_type:complete